MKTTITVEKEVELKSLQVIAHVRYWSDATVNGVKGDDEDNEDNDLGIPFREGETWCPSIDIDSGRIEHWPQGTTASVHYKVVDSCGWALIAADGSTVKEVQDGYVPNTLSPAGRGYGDYIKMVIDENGMITNWRFDPNDFLNADE